MMYAIAEIAGKQFKVFKSQRLYTPKLKGDVGHVFELDKVFLLEDLSGLPQIGSPFLSNVTIKAKILDHVKDDKVIVFKKKRRNGYRVKRGHRQQYTQILVEDIINKAK